MTFKRYAVYFGPCPGEPLHEFGKSWFGIDPETGLPVTAFPLPGFTTESHADLIAAPRHYALHGTLKPPFRLADGTDCPMLIKAVAALATGLQPVNIGRLKLTELGGFLALCPSAPVPALSDLAAECVRSLDPFRAPPSEAELSRRRANGLTPRQDDNLRRWGYPYVLEDFRFHITLTGRLDDAKREAITLALLPKLTPVLTEPVLLRDLCVYGEPGDGSPFQVVDRIPL